MSRALAAALLLAAFPAHADAPAPQTTAGQALRQILHDNDHFVATHSTSYFAPFRDEQHPVATVVSCSDSRVDMGAFSSHPDGNLFVIRNIGNQVDFNAGSVAYGVHHLHTPLLLIVGHVHCGAVKAAMGDYSAEPSAIRRELDGLHLSLLKTAATGSEEARWEANVIGNVKQQVANALQAYGAEVREGTLTVVGAVYDFRGDLGKGEGRLSVVNVNGETDPREVRKQPVDAGRASAIAMSIVTTARPLR